VTSRAERVAERLQAALAFLAERGTPTPRSDIVAHLLDRFPPAGDEPAVVSTGDPQWLNDFLWKTTNLVKAGWITKDGRGTWTITEAGEVVPLRCGRS